MKLALVLFIAASAFAQTREAVIADNASLWKAIIAVSEEAPKGGMRAYLTPKSFPIRKWLADVSIVSMDAKKILDAGSAATLSKDKAAILAATAKIQATDVEIGKNLGVAAYPQALVAAIENVRIAYRKVQASVGGN